MNLSKRFEYNVKHQAGRKAKDERSKVLEKTRTLLELHGNRVLRQSARKVGDNWIVKVEIIAHPDFSISDDYDFADIHMDIIDKAIPIKTPNREI